MNELNLFCFIINILLIILCGLFYSIIPTLTRKSFLFGVKIPPNEQNCAEARDMKKRYIRIHILGTSVILLLIIIQYIIVPNITLIATMFFPLLFIAIHMIAYVPSWKRAVRLKETRKWEVSTMLYVDTVSSHSRGTLLEIPNVWYITGIILIFISAIIVLFQYPSLPENIPTHFDINGNPDAWTEKSIMSILLVPITNLSILIFIWLIGVLVVKAKLQIDPLRPALSFAQHRMYRRQIGHCLGFMALSIVVSFAPFGFMPVWPDLRIPASLSFLPTIISTIPLVWVSIRSGQGGCKLVPKAIPKEPDDQSSDHNTSVGRGDDKYWVLGMFYYNPDDPAIIIEDRFGNGIGFNFARMLVKFGVVLLALIFIVCYFWVSIRLSKVI